MRVAGESLTLSSARREYGLVAGDQSAARLARVIIGHVGGDVHTETVARELVVHSKTFTYVPGTVHGLTQLTLDLLS